MRPNERGERLGRWSSGRGPLHLLLSARDRTCRNAADDRRAPLFLHLLEPRDGVILLACAAPDAPPPELTAAPLAQLVGDAISVPCLDGEQRRYLSFDAAASTGALESG